MRVNHNMYCYGRSICYQYMLYCILYIHVCVTSCEVDEEHCCQLCDLIMIGGLRKQHKYMWCCYYGSVHINVYTRNCTTTSCQVNHDGIIIVHDWFIYLLYDIQEDVMMHICFSTYVLFVIFYIISINLSRFEPPKKWVGGSITRE